MYFTYIFPTPFNVQKGIPEVVDVPTVLAKGEKFLLRNGAATKRIDKPARGFLLVVPELEVSCGIIRLLIHHQVGA